MTFYTKKMKKLSLTFILALSFSVTWASNDTNTVAENILENQPEEAKEVLALRNRNAFKKGLSIISTGYGIPNFGKSSFNSVLDEFPEAQPNITGIGTFFLRYEYAFHKRWGAGIVARLNHSATNYPHLGSIYDDDEDMTPLRDTVFNYKANVMNIGIMGRINYHFYISKKIDAYAGVGIGYLLNLEEWSYGTDEQPDPVPSSLPAPVDFEVTAGIRWYVTDVFGFYAEGGYSRSLANAGITFKF